MCGINGLFSYSGVGIDRAAEKMAAMNERIRHRGPDDRGYWQDPSGRVVFGHLRLSIIDLSPSGHQPMISRKGTIIVFNGEIYNYKEIRDRFFKNENLKSSSDTEILLLLYEKFGEKCLEYLNGMFAFAIWDPEKEELFLARDKAGKKPIYYSVQNGVFAFSSEIKALLELPYVNAELDEEALYHFLTYNLLPPPLTMFRGIHKFHPAHKMKVTKRGIESYSPYWEVSYSDLRQVNEQEIGKRISEAFTKAVNYRMVSDVPVGAFLSGGVDSSAVVAGMAKQSPHPVKTYSIGFDGQPDYDELKYAAQVAKKYGTDHYEKIVTPQDIRDFLPRIIDIFDEPMADSTCIPIYFISEKARANGTIVVLTGDGSDELFAGYRNWQKFIRRQPAFELYSSMPGFVKRSVAAVYEKINPSSPLTDILYRAANHQEFFWGGARSFKESRKRNFLSQEFNRHTSALNSYSVISEFREQFRQLQKQHPQLKFIDWMCYLGFKFNIPNFYLYRMDRLGMAHSIEIRTPFLDTDFVNLALSVPGALKIKNAEPKYIFKKSQEQELGHDLLYRKKQGFNVPLREWAGDLLTEYVEGNLKSFCADHPQFSFTGLSGQLSRLKSGDRQVTNQLWTLYFLMNWFKKWLP
ncbi:MAG TPA: asparagine synthase (glutamine-hydrolyzing) [Bacteroidia bacterium]|nr:asparagine synthase (glutamine-hydrolyzing) [Bacteroidia bacterium]